MVIDTDEVFHDGKYCIKTILSNGTTRYTTNRGVVDRLSKSEAEYLANEFNKQYKKARENNNPICYTCETFVYGPYEQLLVLMGGKEELVECELAEVALYNETIAKLYNDCETFYSPIIYLTVEGDPFILDGILVKIGRFLKDA